MIARRILTGFAATAAALFAFAPVAAHADAAAPAEAAAPVKWGPYVTADGKAKVLGTLIATPKAELADPADKVTVSGKLYDNTRAANTCGWVVFRFGYLNAKNEITVRTVPVRNCTYGKPAKFEISRKKVYEVEVKVCAQPKKATAPSLTCLYAGSWKSLYSYLNN